MPSANEELRAAAVRHAVYLSRFQSGAAAKIIATLDAADKDIIKQIARRGSSDRFTDRRLKALLVSIKRIIDESHVAFSAAMRKELRALASYEVGYQAKTIIGAAGFDPGIVRPSLATVYSAALSKPLQGRILNDWSRALPVDKARAVEAAIRMGIVEGESLQQIVQRVRGTKSAGYKDGVLAIHRRHASAVVKTATNHVTTVARDHLYQSNLDVVKEWQFVATLDTRTTEECASLDGKTFKVGSGPQPPRHFNCRSTTTPVLKSWKELGIPAEELPPGTRASMNGQVPATMTYQSWLKGQPASVQREVLGANRYKLFSQGGLQLDRFVDSTGRKYTLVELARRESKAWKAAGLGGGG